MSIGWTNFCYFSMDYKVFQKHCIVTRNLFSAFLATKTALTLQTTQGAIFFWNVKEKSIRCADLVEDNSKTEWYQPALFLMTFKGRPDCTKSLENWWTLDCNISRKWRWTWSLPGKWTQKESLYFVKELIQKKSQKHWRAILVESLISSNESFSFFKLNTNVKTINRMFGTPFVKQPLIGQKQDYSPLRRVPSKIEVKQLHSFLNCQRGL